MINKIFNFLQKKWIQSTDTRLTNHWKKKGVSIGYGTSFHDRKTVHIDLGRPSLIKIGNNVRLNKNFTLLCHDATYTMLREIYKELIPGWGKVEIGDNVYFGWNCTVLKGAKIGSNCIIGIGSVVTGKIPENSVAGGNPAKVICTIDEFYQKRKIKYVEDTLDYAKSIKERFNREPVITDFWDEYPLFLNGGEEQKYNFPFSPASQFKDAYEYHVNNHKAIFNGFDDFMRKTNL